MNTKLVIGTVAVAAVAIVGGSILLGGVGAPAEPTPTPTPEPPPPVTAKGNLLPIREAKLGFRTLGEIAVMPKVGDRFEAGQEIARLDTTELDLAIRQAEDAVVVARASLEQVAAPVRAEDLAAAEAAHQGAVARHNGLLAGASSAEVRTAEVAVAAAEASLAAAKQRVEALDPNDATRLAAIKNAELALDQAKNTLWSTQIDRDATKGLYGADSGQGRAADARVAAAETAVTQAEAALESAKRPATAAEVRAAADAASAAQSDLTAAKARLAKIQAGPTAEEKEASAALVAQAKAAVDLRKNGASTSDVAVLQAQIKQAQTGLELAKAARRNAVVVAPFGGTVVATAASVGEIAQPGAPLLTLVDPTKLQVETTDLDEASAVRLAVGIPVKVRLNAFGDEGSPKERVVAGEISRIAPRATLTAAGDANYAVTVLLKDADPSLLLGMTARVEFPISQEEWE